MTDDPVAHELVVTCEELPPVRVAERLEELRGADDVGEEERTLTLDPAEELLGTLLVEPRAELLERGEGRLQLRGSAVLGLRIAGPLP